MLGEGRTRMISRQSFQLNRNNTETRSSSISGRLIHGSITSAIGEVGRIFSRVNKCLNFEHFEIRLPIINSQAHSIVRYF